jgi:type IV pilus modification protein PilV
LSKDAIRPGMATGESGVASGFALVETLTALLLLAIALLGTLAALIHGIADNHSARLRSQAADLAADLAESIRNARAPLRENLTTQWRTRVASALPLGNPALADFATLTMSSAPGESPVQLNVALRWWDPATHAPTRLELPIVLDAHAQQ